MNIIHLNINSSLFLSTFGRNNNFFNIFIRILCDNQKVVYPSEKEGNLKILEVFKRTSVLLEKVKAQLSCKIIS